MTEPSQAEIEPGTLLARVGEVARESLASGALDPLATATVPLEEAGIPLTVRVLAGMERKIALTRKQRRTGTNPFLPPDPELYVGGFTPTHGVLLNKYPVLEDHLLLVTREYRRQESALDRDDLAAALAGLREFPSLAFYNGGRAAGSSQGHKHLQLVPLPEGGMPLAERYLEPGPSRSLPFQSAARYFDEDDPESALAAYREMLERAGCVTSGDPRPYNLLMTRRWIAVVPRSHGLWNGIPTNGLGYAGILFALDDRQLSHIRDIGPLGLLQKAGVPW